MYRTLVLSLFLAPLAAAEDAKPDKEAIAGGWKVAACELQGKLLPDSAFKDLTYTMVADGRWKLEGGPGFPKAAGGTFVLDPKASPKTVDFIPADGQYKGKTFQGIYQLDGDELKACFAFPGKDRPKTFLTAPQSGLVLEFWRRTKK